MFNIKLPLPTCLFVAISTQEYIFVAGNYFCKTHSNLYVPAELALVKYNPTEGYGNKYHVFINPGKNSKEPIVVLVNSL